MSGDACSVMGVCSLLLMMCSHERECEYHSIEEGPKLLRSCSLPNLSSLFLRELAQNSGTLTIRIYQCRAHASTRCERFLRQSMVELLTLQGKCSPLKSKC